jgi:hypothetical protein
MDIWQPFVNHGIEIVQGQHTIKARTAMTYLADVFMVDLISYQDLYPGFAGFAGGKEA